MSLLHRTNDSVRAKYPATSLSCHVMYAFLNDKIPKYHDAISVSEIVMLLEKEEPKVLPTKASVLTPLFQYLSEIGFIVFFATASVDSWVIVDQNTLLDKVNGALFAPKHFTENLQIASNTGVIPVVALGRHFPNYNIDVIVQFLTQFELCHQISLSYIHTTNMTPKCPLPINDGRLLFFPSLVEVDLPKDIIASLSSCAILITHLFLSPHFLHVLILRLAYLFCLPKDISDPQFHQLNRLVECGEMVSAGRVQNVYMWLWK